MSTASTIAFTPALASAALTPAAARVTGDVLLATDGAELAGNAARVALAVAERHGRVVRVVHAVDMRGVALPPPLDIAIGLADEAVGPAVHESQRAEVRAGLAAALDTSVAEVDWPVAVAIGAPAPVIVREATACEAGLIVLGLRRHGPLGRALQDEIALHVMRHARCPVLAVAPSLHDAPRRVVVAVDFGRTSRAAAALAGALVAPGGTLTLVYVPPPPALIGDEGQRRVHTLGVGAAFEELRAPLRALTPEGVTIETVVLGTRSDRPVGEQLIELARRTGADLLALGSRRHGPFERWLLGSVATDVARDGSVSVLVVPPDATTDETTSDVNDVNDLR